MRPAEVAPNTGGSNHRELPMSRNEIYDALSIENSDTVQRHRRGAIEALLTSHSRNGKPVRRYYRDADDRHERRRPTAHAAMRDARY